MSLPTITLPLTDRKRTNRREATNPLTNGKRAPRRMVLSIERPTVLGPATEHERWVERVEARRRGGMPLHHPLLKETPVALQTVTVPRRQGPNAIPEELVREIHEAAMRGVLQPREAIVVATGRDTENSARNRARAVADRYREDYARIPDPNFQGEGEPPLVDNPIRFSAHAVPDPNAAGKFVGAISMTKAKPAEEAPSAEAANANGAPPPAAKAPETRTPPAKKS